MSPKNADSKCALLVMTDGIEETETVEILCKLRQIGLCVKSVGLTGGLVVGAHGILLKPDLTLADFEANTPDIRAVKTIILMQRNQGLTRLETEPRLHNLLGHILRHGGYMAVNQDCQKIIKAMGISVDQLKTYRKNRQILIRDWKQPFDTYADELIRCFELLE